MKTALFFGSFNPVHIGHLAIANYIAEFADVDELWFVVSPHNPLKEKSGLLADRLRYELVHKSVEGYPKFKVSDIEFKLPQPSYTIHTLTYLKEKYPKREFMLILGSDNLVHFHKWKNYEQILQNHKLLVYPRPGTPEEIYAKYPGILKINAPQMDVSATFIRDSIKQGKDIRFFLPEAAWKMIDEMHYYRK
jgi:nicotinate-nucleotide adenylyltransferase